MESTVSYIVIAALIVISVYVYNLRKNRISTFSISIQQFPALILIIKIKKNKGRIEDIIIEIQSKSQLEIISTKAELISKTRDFNYYDLQNIAELKLPLNLEKGKSRHIILSFNSFKSLLMDGEHPFRTFRFTITDSSGKKYKSHELGFNKKWVLYKPDSGHYN